MTIAAQAMRKKEVLKKEYSEKAATGALYDELFKGIESLKKAVFIRLMKHGRK